MVAIRLLLVDDEERFLNTTKILLERRGASTITAISGPEAFKILDEEDIDVVILDVKMPEMDGVEILRRMKKKYPSVEVILLTGHASVESAVEGLKLGAFDYVMKPCDIDDMWAKVKEAYANKGASAAKSRKPMGSIIDKRITQTEKR